MNYVKTINNNILTLLKTKFSEYINQDNFIFNVGVENKEIPLISDNIEKICFAVGPGKLLKNNVFLYPENKIKENFIDFAYIAPYNNSSVYMGLIENKQLDGSIDNTIVKAVEQIYFQYLLNLLDNKENFFQHSDERPNNISLSICIFDPIKYLNNPYNFNNYCNDGSSNKEQRIDKYGFVILTAFVNVFSIKKLEDLQKEFDKFSSNNKKDNLSYIIPDMKVFQGYIQKDAFDSILNTNVTISFEQLSNLPFFNINTSSQISNTRDFSLNNMKAEKFKQEIFKTLLINFRASQDKKNSINISESYRSLGAKNREVSFYIPQTIVFLDENRQQKMHQKAFYLTTNMSLIDGQHSSIHLIEILKSLAINDMQTLDNSYKTIINKIYTRESDFVYEDFKKFVKEHHVNISFKGFSKEEVAQKAAANQNNIKKQTAFEKLLNNNRAKLLKVINFYNQLNSNYKMTVNKSSWSNDLLINNNIKTLSAEYLVNIWAFWNEKFFEEYSQKDLNKIIGKQSSLTTANTNNFSKAIEWFLKKNKSMIELNKKILDLISIIEKLEEYDDTADNTGEDNIEALIKNYEKQIIKLDEFYEKNKNQFSKDKLDRIIGHLLTSFEDDKEDYSNLLDNLSKLLNKLDNMQEVFEDRVKNGLKIIVKSFEYYQSNSPDFSFLEERKTEAYFYILNIINLFLVLSLKNKNISHSLDNVTDELINNIILEVQQRLIKANQYVKIKNMTLATLHFGNNQHTMDIDFHEILFKKII